MRPHRFALGSCAWFLLACCGALLGCGGRSSHSADMEPNSAGGSAGVGGTTDVAGNANNAGSAGNANGIGGELSGGDAGARSGATAGAGATAGSGATAGGETALGGSAGELGAPGPVNLCLYPEQIPDNWAVADASVTSCAVGELGPFVFDGCQYELLEAEANDADPFQGGHSHCCYRSKLRGCP